MMLATLCLVAIQFCLKSREEEEWRKAILQFEVYFHRNNSPKNQQEELIMEIGSLEAERRAT